MRPVIRILFVFFFFQCIGTGSGLYAQTLQWSPPLQDYTKVPFLKIIGSDDTNIYLLRSNFSFETLGERARSKNRKYLMQCLGHDLHLKWEHELSLPSEDARVADVVMMNDRVLQLNLVYDKSAKLFHFSLQPLDTMGQFAGTPVTLDDLLEDETDDDKKPKLVMSHDQNFIAFAYRKVADDKTAQAFRVTVMDSSLQKIYSKEIRVPLSTRLFSPESVLLTNKGNFYILGMKYLTEKKVKAPGESFYQLLGYDKTSDTTFSEAIKVEDKFLTDVGISSDNRNGQVLVAGFYSDKTTYTTAGVFYYSWDEDSLKAGKVYVSPFTQSYLMKFIGDQKDVRSRELMNYSIDRLILRRDGGAVIVAESFYQTSRSYWDYYMQTMITHYYYHFGSIMMLSINPDGNILWNNVITKDQNSVDDIGYYSSYASAISGGIMYAAYNKYGDDESPVLLTAVDGQGRQNTKTLFKDNERVVLMSRSGKQIDEETLLIPAYRQNKFYFLSITF